MQNRHQTPDLYFREQSYTTKQYVIPFISGVLPVTNDLSVLEIGCGHGGNMEPFLDIGCRVTGLDINPGDIAMAESFLKDHPRRTNLRLLATDIYDASADQLGSFDLIVMKDVIEHIHDQQKFLRFIRRFLNEEGRIFLGFPPWYMPFGGHQQVCKNRWLANLPYIHLLPAPLYKQALEMFGEKPARVSELLEVKETGLSIERFRKIVREQGYQVERENLYLVNPNYEIKFHLKPRRQLPVVSSLYFLRNFVTTCCYSLVRPERPAS